MAKKEEPTHINTNVNTNTNIVNVHIPHQQRHRMKKERKPNWFVKAIVLAVIGLISSIIIIYIKNSTAANGKPAFIQNGTAPLTQDKK